MKQRQKNRSITLLKLTKEDNENTNKDVINLKNKNDRFNIVNWELQNAQAQEPKMAAQLAFLEQRIQDIKLQNSEIQATPDFNEDEFTAFTQSTFPVKPVPDL